MSLSPAPARLALRGISKRFGATQANAEIDLSIRPGEIHALLGENGAGKSTLVKIIYGVVHPDQGEIIWEGRAVVIGDPRAARALGIGMVFQHFSLFETLTVVENIALGLDVREDMASLALRVRAVSDRYGLALDPRRHVHHLSVGERQRVEILRCLLQEPRLLILDEPTSVLTPQEAEGLFTMVRRLAAEGCSVLYISHKLEEIQALCHHATILRAGRLAGACDPTTETPRAMAEKMVGAALPECRRGAPPPFGPPCLTVAHLTLAADEPFGTDLKDIGLTLHAGEIIGIAGVAGNGQKELLAALAGERTLARAETILVGTTPAGRLGPVARRRLGLSFIPEERLGRGAVGELSLAENLLLTAWQSGLVRHGFIDFAALAAAARRVFADRRVVAAGIEAQARSLSGGNMQKFIVGREIGFEPRVVIAAHPTWGVDIGATLAIRQALMDLSLTGAGILVVSEDLAELFEISDRIAVLSDGRLSPPRPTAETTTEEVGMLMGGVQRGEEMPDAA